MSNKDNSENIEMDVDMNDDPMDDAAPAMRRSNREEDPYNKNAWSNSLRSFLLFNNPNLEKPTKRRSLPLSPKTYLYVSFNFPV